MNLELRIDKVYGRETIYPHCAKSKLLAQMKGTKTFSRQDIRIMGQLGYKIQFSYTAPEWLKEAVALAA
jgi:hypothetical protein